MTVPNSLKPPPSADITSSQGSSAHAPGLACVIVNHVLTLQFDEMTRAP